MIYNFLVTLQWHFQNRVSDGGVKNVFYSHLYNDSCVIWFPTFFDSFVCAEGLVRNLRKEIIFCRASAEHCILPYNDTFLTVNAWTLFQKSTVIKVKLSHYIQVLSVQPEGKQL